MKTPLYLQRLLSTHNLSGLKAVSHSIFVHPTDPYVDILSIQLDKPNHSVNIFTDGRFQVLANSVSIAKDGNEEHDILQYTSDGSIGITQALTNHFSDQIDGAITYEDTLDSYLFKLKNGNFVCAGTSNKVLEAEIWTTEDSFGDGCVDGFDIINIDGIDYCDYTSQEYLA